MIRNLDTISAIATPTGKAGIAIVRVSGEKSKDILKAITHCDAVFLPRYMYLKEVYLNGIKDNALVVYFKAPFSYTGEDIVEIQCHGGYFVAKAILDETIRLGSRLAEPGEFSKRAFLNGKMTIDQAEGIMDIINAETTSQAKASSELISGELAKIISNIQSSLTDIIASVEAKLDYPEYDFETDELDDLEQKIDQISCDISDLIKTGFKGSMIKNGVKVAIVGEPNVGKSSLLNALTNSNRAIVTDIAGTTRDIVESEYEYKGILFRLFDTAGIHESTDIIEKIGIERAKEMINSSDIVLSLSNGKNELNIDGNKNIIKVYTKSDINNYAKNKDDRTIFVSSKTGENIEELKNKIFNLTMSEGYDDTALYITNSRHIEALKSGLEALKRAKLNLKSMSLDFIVSDLKICWQKIGEITGQTSNEDIIDRIFEKFCLGK